MIQSHPHKICYWLHSSEKTEAPESFARKVNEICCLYECAQMEFEYIRHGTASLIGFFDAYHESSGFSCYGCDIKCVCKYIIGKIPLVFRTEFIYPLY